MTVCYVTRRNDNTGSREAERNQLLYEVDRRKYTYSYNVRVSSHLDGPTVIMSSSLVPQLGRPYVFGKDSDAFATCVKVSVPKRLTYNTWIVIADFDTGRIMSNVTDDPFLQPPEIKCSSSSYQVAYPRDYENHPYINSALRPFDPPPVVDEKPALWTITRNEASSSYQVAYYASLGVSLQLFTQEKVKKFKMKCNLKYWQNNKPYSVRINDIQATRMVSYARVYYQVTYELEIRPERLFIDWTLDKSWTDINNRPFLDEMLGQPLANETLLNGRGLSLRKEGYCFTSAAGTAIDTDIYLDSRAATFFPKSYPYEISIGDEIMQVTGPHIDALAGHVYVTRGFSRTTPAIFGLGVRVQLQPYYIPFEPHGREDFCSLQLPLLPTGPVPSDCPTNTCGNVLTVNMPGGYQAKMSYQDYIALCDLYYVPAGSRVAIGSLPTDCTLTVTIPCPTGITVTLPDASVRNMDYGTYLSYCQVYGFAPQTMEYISTHSCAVTIS